eukprot:498321-Pyramimonas_sp.AAC.3
MRHWRRRFVRRFVSCGRVKSVVIMMTEKSKSKMMSSTQLFLRLSFTFCSSEDKTCHLECPTPRNN